MRNNKVYDMTKDNPVKLLWSFTWPMLIGNIFQQFYNIVDSIVIGRFEGADALASVGACSSLSFLLFALSFGVALGIGVVVSHAFGAERDDMVEKSIINGIYLLGVVAIITGIVGFCLAGRFLELLGTPENIIENSTIYIQVSCVGCFAVAAYNGISSILRALGDSKTPIYFMVVSCFVNIILDLLFVITFKWSVFGVALATIIAQSVSAIGAFIYALKKVPYFRIKRQNMVVNMGIIKQCFSIGVPLAMQNALIACSTLFLQSVINGFGKEMVAAYTAIGRIELLVHQPFSSLSSALTAYTGQNMGAKKMDRVKEGYKIGLISVAIISVTMLVLNQSFSEELMKIFVTETAVVEIGSKGIKITSLFYFLLGMIYIPRGILNGAGDTVFTLINGVAEVCGRIIFALILTRIPFIGMWGVFMTTGLTWGVTGIISMHRYYRGKWIYKKIVEAN